MKRYGIYDLATERLMTKTFATVGEAEAERKTKTATVVEFGVPKARSRQQKQAPETSDLDSVLEEMRRRFFGG